MMDNKKTKDNIKCCALDTNGDRCRNKAAYEIYYHGDSEIYYDTVQWVLAHVCRKHYNQLR